MDNMDIIKLTDAASPHLETMEGWMFNWWGREQGFSMEKLHSYLARSLYEDRIPMTFAAIDGGRLLGMCQLSMSDLDVRPDIYPWLVNVYVDEAARGRGVMRAMMERVDKELPALGFRSLYLFTMHEKLYERFGFDFVESFDTFIDSARIQRLYVKRY